MTELDAYRRIASIIDWCALAALLLVIVGAFAMGLVAGGTQ